MTNTRAITIRATDEEADLLAAYAEQNGQSQSDVLRSHIRSLERHLRRVSAATIEPFLLPSIPASHKGRSPSVSAVYFFMTVDGDVLYVGHAENLFIRLSTHHKFSHIFREHPDFRIHWIEKRTDREGFESKCIARFNPPFNTRK